MMVDLAKTPSEKRDQELVDHLLTLNWVYEKEFKRLTKEE
jgi:hypothetical protein